MFFYWLGYLPTQILKWTWHRFSLGKLFILTLVLALFIFTPNPGDLKNQPQPLTTSIYDRYGNLLWQVYKDENRVLVNLKEIPPVLISATLAAEDAEFWQHWGFSLKGMLRAAKKYLQTGQLTGGSTITQQLVKNTLLSPQKTLKRKVIELVVAIKVEIAFSKNEILELYLNETPYGGSAYGVRQAAKVFLGKDLDDLNLAEAAYLAGLPKSPTRFNPFGTNPELGFERQREVLHLMRVNRYISLEEEQAALNTQLTFTNQHNQLLAPHFVMLVKEQSETLFGQEAVATGGLKIITTLDLNLQRLLEKAIREEMPKIRKLGAQNAAGIILQPQTGEILAMVGSANFWDKAIDGQVNSTLALRQTGSAIKPLTYTLALQEGYTPLSLLQDTPITFPLASGPYSPQNYDRRFLGTLTLRSALAQSRNVPAVKLLAQFGPEKLGGLATQMGLAWPKNLGLSATLGAVETPLLDLTAAYAVYANQGRYLRPNAFLKVTGSRGQTLFAYQCNPQPVSYLNKVFAVFSATSVCQPRQVLDPRLAFLITDILKDEQARQPAFGRSSALSIKGHPEVSVKTGTTNNLRDNLTVGYNQNYVVGIWVGNNNNFPLSTLASGITGAAPIWNRVFTQLLANTPPTPWNVPEGVVNLKVCSLSGTLSCSNCADRTEWFLLENQPQQSCNPTFVDRIRRQRQELGKTTGELFETAASTQR